MNEDALSEKIKNFVSDLIPQHGDNIKAVGKKINEEVSEFIAKHTDSIEAAGKNFDKKMAEERQQYSAMGGIGEYFTHNLTSLLSNTARAVGLEEYAQEIERKRGEFVAGGKSFDKKMAEERQQYSTMGGIGEYVAHNLNSVLANAARSVGSEEYAQKIERKRGDFVEGGKSFDKKMADERQQYSTMGGIGEYVANNLNSALANTVRSVGLEEYAQEIERKRGEFVASGKNFDKKIAEERQQYSTMGGIGEYFAHNLTSLLSNTARAVGSEEYAQKIEYKRGEFVTVGKNFDKKIKAEYEKFKQSEGIGQYVSQSITGMGKEKKDAKQMLKADSQRFQRVINAQNQSKSPNKRVASTTKSVINKNYLQR